MLNRSTTLPIAALIFFLSFASLAFPQKLDGLYLNTFGDPSHPALVFVHGGPGYNSWNFELTTAPKLASLGYYVVVYDQRGQGRSDTAPQSVFNYKQYADDLKEIIDYLGIKSPVLLGHSHGGPIVVNFDKYYPGEARKIVLISATLNMWGSLHSLFENCARLYTKSGSEDKLGQLAYLYDALFDTPSLPAAQLRNFVTAAFAIGATCGIYQPQTLTPRAQALRREVQANPLPGPLSGITTAVPGFLENDNYIHQSWIDYVGTHRDHFCGIYGDEDGLFTPLELALVRNTLEYPGESGRFHLVHGSSHFIYMDQQDEFLSALRGTCGI